MKQNYLLTTLPGIGKIAKLYLEQKFRGSVRVQSIVQMRSNDLLLVDFEGRLTELMEPSMLEDVFALITTIKLNGEKQDLQVIKKYLSKTQFGYYLPSDSRKVSKGTVRVVVQAADMPWRQYRRQDIKKIIEKALHINPAKLKIVSENARMELWAQQYNDQLFLSIRLSNSTLRHREYKIADYPGSLRPTIANAMVFLSKPAAGDTFLDPMCGAGTIIIERALAARYELLLGGDHSQGAINATLENLGKKHKPWEVKVWDTTRLPLESESIDKIVTNPPWGVQFETTRDFYSKLVDELERVLKPAGLLVFLLKAGQNLPQSKLKQISRYPGIRVLGQKCEVLVMQKL